MRARAPASSANLGPGFDVLAVALDCYVRWRSSRPLAARAQRGGGRRAVRRRVAPGRPGGDRGHGPRPPGGHGALADPGRPGPGLLRRRWPPRPPPPPAPTTPSPWPPRTTDIPRTRRPVSSGAGRGHHGGRRPCTRRSRSPTSWPSSRSCPTGPRHRPRPGGVLPETSARADAVFNLGRMGLLLAGLADPALLVADATADRIHQPARTALFPEAPALLCALVDAGALAASWSGAGPSLIGIVRAVGGGRAGRGAGGAGRVGRARAGPGAAGGPPRPRLRGRGRGPAVEPGRSPAERGVRLA